MIINRLCPADTRSGAANNWWLRSPNTGNTNNFWNVNSNGNVNNNNANNAYGIAFGSSQSRQSNRKAKSDLTGEKEGMTFRKVNIRPDASGWTLLAWRGLKVMPRFIAGDATPLYATFRQGYGVTEDFI